MNFNRFSKELEAITSNDKLFNTSHDEIIEEIAKRMTLCLNVERVNLWLFDDEEECIECIGNYSKKTGSFTKGDKLHMVDFPAYYSTLKSNQVIIVNDVNTDPITAEIRSTYCLKHGITALLDLPVKLEGKLAGVMCYEFTGGVREWAESEVHFTQAINQVVSLAFETRVRRKTQVDLIKALEEKELLLKEMHHRIKNNLSVLVSLLRLQASESENKDLAQKLDEAQHRIFSMVKIHEQLYQTGNYLNVNLAHYLRQLVKEFESSADNQHHIAYQCDLQNFEVETSVAINIGLIAIELLNNSIKHAFKNSQSNNQMTITLHKKRKIRTFTVSDNGDGIKPNKDSGSPSIGMSIIEDLTEQIDGNLKIESNKKGTKTTIEF